MTFRSSYNLIISYFKICFSDLFRQSDWGFFTNVNTNRVTQNKVENLRDLNNFLPTVAYLTNVCLLAMTASTATFSKYCAVITAMVGCNAWWAKVIRLNKKPFKNAKIKFTKNEN